MIKVAVCGAAGRMGKRILTLASEMKGQFEISGAVDFSGCALKGLNIKDFTEIKDSSVSITDSLEFCVKETDVVIDFSVPEATIEHTKICARNNTPIVIGTTGLTDNQAGILKSASESLPIVFAPNMSVGVNLLFNLVKKVAAILDDNYDIEIVEAHHRFKKDAPSGTAKRLAELVAEGRNVSLEETGVYGRHGITGERKTGTIGIHAVRMGNVVGDHTVSFANLGERFELTHKAQSRNTFALGSLKAAMFIIKADKGLYDMQDVLGLKD